MLTISSINAFNDNYIWLIENTDQDCAIIDPGESEIVLKTLQEKNLNLRAILLTHHHSDHTDGVAKIKQVFPKAIVYAPNTDRFIHVTHRLQDKDAFTLLGKTFFTIKTPGHTKDHIAFYSTGMLFCGDSLFSAGCGRLFEGTADEMYASLNRLASLPDNTLVYSAHEYTLSNLNFALCVEPENTVIQETISWAKKQREQELPTLPSSIGKEKEINPFLRCDKQQVKNAVRKQVSTDSPIAVFAALRKWKDNF